MEGLSPLQRRVAGIDLYRMPHMGTVLIEQPDGSVAKHSREFGGFERYCPALAAWLAELQVHLVVIVFVLRRLSESVDEMQRQLGDIDAYLMRAMQPYAWAHSLLQTIPGIDKTAAALLLIEIGDDMTHFAPPQRLAAGPP